MWIGIVSPAPPRSYQGNGVTAARWAQLLRQLGHTVDVVAEYAGEDVEVLVALHARKSASAVTRFARAHPGRPLVVALTGTDIYPDLSAAGVDVQVLERADRLIVLQPLAVEQLPTRLRPRARVILQSVEAIPVEPPRPGVFEVALLAHIRPVKDPFCLAEALELLPQESRIHALHLGSSLEPGAGEQARELERRSRRYRWLGEVPRPDALRLLSRCRLMVLTSWSEGGANAVSEAIATGVPVLSSRIPGSIGLLGADYPGYFTPGDRRDLAHALRRLELNEGGLLDELRDRCARLQPLFEPAREREAWARLLDELRSEARSSLQTA